jgi:hypothetical protein
MCPRGDSPHPQETAPAHRSDDDDDTVHFFKPLTSLCASHLTCIPALCTLY